MPVLRNFTWTSNAKINDIDAVKITAGYIDADRIQAGLITVSKLADETNIKIQSSGIDTNVIADPNFQMTYDGDFIWNGGNWSTPAVVGDYGE